MKSAFFDERKNDIFWRQNPLESNYDGLLIAYKKRNVSAEGSLLCGNSSKMQWLYQIMLRLLLDGLLS